MGHSVVSTGRVDDIFNWPPSGTHLIASTNERSSAEGTVKGSPARNSQGGFLLHVIGSLHKAGDFLR